MQTKNPPGDSAGTASRRPPPSTLNPPAKRWSRKRRFGTFVLVFLLLIGSGVGIMKVYGNELLPPMVDAARSIFGVEAVAQLESDVYGMAEQWRQVQRDWGIAPKVAAPWDVNTPTPGGPDDTAIDPAPAAISGGGSGGIEAALPTAPAAPLAADAPPTDIPTDTPTAVVPTPTDTPEATPPGMPLRSWSAPRPTETATATAAPSRTPRPRHPSSTPSVTLSPTETPLPTADAYPNGADPATGEVPYVPETPSLTPTPTDTPTDTPTPTPTDTALPTAAPPTSAPEAPPVAAPTRAPAAPPAVAPTRAPVAPPAAPPSSGRGPASIAPIIKDGALPGEGVWVSNGLPAPPGGGAAGFWKTFLRPDPARPDALVYLVRFNPNRLALHMVAGIQEPVSANPVPRTGMISPGDIPNLAAAFNGGWKSVHGNYGMQVDGTVIAPARPSAMTLVQSWSGRLLMGPWSRVGGGDLKSFRQNCPPMIDNGQILVTGHTTTTWGLSLLNEMFVWRSGLGQLPDGSYVYAAGTPLSVDELAAALQRAGATEAMQLDINSAWVRWVNYLPTGNGGVRASGLVPAMYVPATQYLSPVDRDFFYLTWK